MQTYYSEYFANAWSYPSIMIASPCKKLWCPVLKSTCMKPWCLFTCKKSTSSLTSFLRFCKLAILVTLWMFDHSSQNHYINLQQAFMLVCMQTKSNSSLTSFLRYYKKNIYIYIYIANLLFWVTSACLAMHT